MSSRVGFFILSWFVVISMQAQMGHNFLQFDDVSGMYQLSPKIDTSSKLTISTTAGVSYLSNSINLGDISTKENGIRLIDFGLGHESLKANNYFNYQNDLNFLHLDYKLSNSSILRFGLNYKSRVQADYTRELFQLLGDGNEQFVGETIPIGAKAHLVAMHQIYLGLQKRVSNFDFTVQLKFISGLNHFRTTNSDISLSTSDDIYQVALASEFNVVTSKALKYNDVDDLSFEFNSIDFSNPFKNNFGYAIDLGVKYHFNKNSFIFINAYDLGSVKWSNLTRTYASNVNTDYEGLDVAEYFETEDEVLLIDSLRSLLQIEETLEDYSSSLSRTIAAGVQYGINDHWTGTLNVSLLDIAGSNTMYFTLGSQRQLTEQLILGATYSYFGGSHSAGLNIGYRPIPYLSLRFSTDSFRSLLSTVDSSVTTYYLGASYRL